MDVLDMIFIMPMDRPNGPGEGPSSDARVTKREVPRMQIMSGPDRRTYDLRKDTSNTRVFILIDLA